MRMRDHRHKRIIRPTNYGIPKHVRNHRAQHDGSNLLSCNLLILRSHRNKHEVDQLLEVFKEVANHTIQSALYRLKLHRMADFLLKYARLLLCYGGTVRVLEEGLLVVRNVINWLSAASLSHRVLIPWKQDFFFHVFGGF